MKLNNHSLERLRYSNTPLCMQKPDSAAPHCCFGWDCNLRVGCCRKGQHSGSFVGAMYKALTRVSSCAQQCSSPHKTSKVGDILYPPRHFFLTLRDDFTTHGFLFKDEIYHIVGCSSHGSNSQECFLSLQLISVALHGSRFHHAAVYIYDSVGYIVLLPKRMIPPDISMLFGFMGSPTQKNQDTVFAAT